MGRVYHRDSNGRFASGGGSSSRPAARGGTLAARSSLTRSRQKLAQNASPAQRGAVTRAKNKASAARQANTTRMSSGVRGVFRRGKVAPAARPAAGAGNGIRRVRRSVPQNGIRPARKLPGRAGRALDSIGRNINEAAGHLRGARRIADRFDRSQTRNMLGSSPMMREVARQSGGNSTARKVVQRRQQRAFEVRDRGNEKIGSRAIFHYQAQLRRLDSPRSERVPFRRKPMSPAQAEKAKARRNAEKGRRLDRALREEMRQDGIRIEPNPKRKRKR